MAFRWHTIREIMTHPLTSQNPFGALKRYVCFHVSHLLFPVAREYPFIGDLKLLVSRGDAGLVGNIYTGLYDFEEMGFLLHFLRQNDLFFDIGANTGVYSVLAAGATGCNVVAVEPVHRTFQRLRGQLCLNQLEERVKCYPFAMGESEGELYMTTDKGTMNHITFEPSLSTQTIQVKSIDSLSSIPPLMIKIDVEGYELPALRGAKQLLSDTRLKAIIIEVNGSGSRNYDFADNEIHTCLVDQGFLPYTYDVKKRELFPLSSPRADQHNTLYLRDLDFIHERLQTAPVRTVLNQSF